MAASRGYLSSWLLSTTAVVGMITVLNFYVDPYRLFASPIVPGYNAKKPALSSHVRITKPYQVLRDQPHTLLIGNSRVEMGIDPQLVCWKPAERPVYNMGIPGSSVYMQVRYAQHALDNAPIKLILYGVDFTDFLNFDGTQPAPSYWPEPNQRFEKRLADTPADVPTPGYAWQSIKDHAAALFTLDALRDSITTLAGQRPATTTRTADGFNPSAPYYRGIVHTEGEYVLFEQKNRALDRHYAGQTWQLYAPGRHWSDEFEAVKRLKLEAQRKGAQLILFINPYHIQYLLMLYRAHLWPLFAQWKRAMLRLADSDPAVPLYDFSGITPYTSEGVPPAGDRRHELKWFWEPGHYRRALGTVMLGEMLGRDCGNTGIAGIAAGTLLTPGNIGTRLAQARNAVASKDAVTEIIGILPHENKPAAAGVNTLLRRVTATRVVPLASPSGTMPSVDAASPPPQ